MVPESENKNVLSLERLHGLGERCSDALQRKKSYTYSELEQLAFTAGFEIRKQKSGSSHFVFKHPTHILKCWPPNDRVVLQKDDGKKAKAYQVEQLVDFIQNAVPKK